MYLFTWILVRYSLGGSGYCSIGEIIMDEETCRDACKTLNLPVNEILGESKCYKDSSGNCFQNYRPTEGSSMICKITEKDSGKYGQKYLIVSICARRFQ